MECRFRTNVLVSGADQMRRGGANRMGAGVNSFSLWCDNCGAVVVHACDFGKKITGYEVKWDVK